MQHIFFRAACDGDVASGALCEKLIARRFVLLSLGVQHNATELKLIDVTPSMGQAAIEPNAAGRAALPTGGLTDYDCNSDA
jgi:hypothetical protein